MFIFFECIETHLMHTGSDYLVNIQNPSSRNFTVTFQSKQDNSSESMIIVANDSIFEGTEAFHLRIVAARFIGDAATSFRAQDGLTNTSAEVIIEDDDCKLMNTPCTICLQTVTRRTYNYMHIMHALFSLTVIEVSWISELIEVTEGERDTLELSAQAFGLYATPIEIGVVCAGNDVTGFVLPGADTISSTDTLEHTIVYHTSTICLQPSPAETLSSYMEAHWRSQMLRPLDLNQEIVLIYRSSTTTWLNHASPLSVLFKKVLWMLSVVLIHVKSQSEFAMMIVSSCLCYINVTITY